MGGPRLTPDDLAKAAEVFAATENYSDAARAVGGSVSGVRAALLRHDIAKKRKLHARAVEVGARAGRRVRRDNLARLETLLVRWVDVPLGLVRGRPVGGVLGKDDRETLVEPGDIARISSVIAVTCDGLETAALNLDKRALSKLTRAKTKAETTAAHLAADLARIKIAAGATSTGDELAALLDGVREFLATRPPKP